MTGNTNDIKPFATGTGALVLTPSAYAALAARLTGFSTGIADPAQLNTVWRQSSVIASAIAQFTADYGPNSVVDDGNVTEFENNFLAALQAATYTSVNVTGIPYAGQDVGVTGNTVVVTSTTPTSTTIEAGQLYVVTKSTLKTTGATTFKNGANSPIPVKWPDGTDLEDNDWPAGGTAFLWTVLISGTLTAQFMTAPRLNFPGLPEQDAVTSGDMFAYYDMSAQAHVKIPFSVLAAAILAGFSSSPGSALLLNTKLYQLEERRASGVNAQSFGSSGQWMLRKLNTELVNQIPGASLNSTNGQISLPAGTFRFTYAGTSNGAGLTMTKLYNVTLGQDLSVGLSSDTYTGFDSSTTSASDGFIRYTSATPFVVSLQQAAFGSQRGVMGDADTGGYTYFNDSYLMIEMENGI